MGPVWTFSKTAADINSVDSSSNSFSFFVCDACLDNFYTYTVVATVVDGIYGIILTDVATSSTANFGTVAFGNPAYHTRTILHGNPHIA